MKTRVHLLAAALALAGACPGFAQDRNIPVPAAELERMLRSEPLRIVSARISRPKAEGDITLKAEVAFGDRAPLTIKVRRAEPGAEVFNNVPRYDLAAYELQKLLMATFKGADEVLCVLQYWLQDVVNPDDVLDPALLKSDAVYERHVGQLNVLTYLIRHRDSNVGNFLVSAEPRGARVFAVDNGVAFDSEDSDRGEAWKAMRVKRLPADVVERLRGLTEDGLRSRLGVLGQWQLSEGHYLPVPPGANLASRSGVRRKGDSLQMGLTEREIAGVRDRAKRLLEMIDGREIVAF